MSGIPAGHRFAPQPEAFLLRSLEQAPIAYAATRGPEHAIFFANSAFRRLTGMAGDGDIGRPFREIFPQRAGDTWLSSLDRAAVEGIATANVQLAPLTSDTSSKSWSCTIWPVDNSAGDTEYCVIEVHERALPDHTLLDVAEQLLLSSLRETALADTAESARSRAVFLSEATQRLTESLDIEMTLAAIASIAVLALPSERSWCIVDVIAKDGSMRRVAIVHPNESLQKIAAGLAGSWQPEADDFFGLPLALRDGRAQVIARISDAMLVSAAHGVENLELLRQLEFVSLLVVPLMVRGAVIGAVTFINGRHEGGFTETDVELAETVAARSALALDNARMYEQAEGLRSEAETSNRAKGEFLTRMSHELRTPLNAISGFVELIDMGLHGPVTALQHADLERIKESSNHLLVLITEILDYTQLSSGGARYRTTDVAVPAVVGKVIDMLQSLAGQKETVCELVSCPAAAVARADPDRLEQIIINLVMNAIKHSPPGGHIRVECDALPDTILLRVTDTGPGIPADKLEAIFEPFMQVGPVYLRTEGGVGLGLTISRDLAVAMHGDLTVESTVGKGSSFTLTLPRAAESGK